MHLLICAIHSCFSVPVAAYTANDFVVVRMSHPFLYSALDKDNVSQVNAVAKINAFAQII